MTTMKLRLLTILAITLLTFSCSSDDDGVSCEGLLSEFNTELERYETADPPIGQVFLDEIKEGLISTYTDRMQPLGFINGETGEPTCGNW